MRAKTTQISITIDTALIAYIDELASINGRSRSGMINWLISKEKAQDEALNEELEVRNAQ